MLLDISERIELEPRELTMWEETMAAFSWGAPSFTHLLYELCNPGHGRVAATFLGPNKVPAWFKAGTNGKRVFIVAERFFALDLMERVFLLAHEVAHPMLGHIVSSSYYRKLGYIQLGFKKLPFNDMLANWAQDYVINDLLIESRIGKFVKGGMHDTRIGTYRDSWIDVYERLLIECQQQSKRKGEDQGEGGSGMPGDDATRKGQQGQDFHLEFGEGEDDNDPDKPITEQEMQEEIVRAQQATASALELARARGKLPAALDYICQKVLEPTVDWAEHLKSQFSRKLGSGGYDFRRPDRRLLVRDIVAPGRAGFRAEIIVLGADSSGSIYSVPQLIERWMGECSGVMEDVRPREIHVVWCDAEIKHVDILTTPEDVKAMYYRPVKGGGGTSFVPVFEYAATLEHPIDCMAYLTDGQGTFPDEAPPYPVIWGSILEPPEHYPFGDVVMIPVPKEAK